MYTISELIGKEAIILADGASAGTVANVCFDSKLRIFKYVLLIFDEHEERKIASFRAITAFKDDAIVIKSSESVIDLKQGGDNLVFCPINLPAFNQDGKALGVIRDVMMEDAHTKEFVTDIMSIDAETLLTASDKLLIFNDTGEKIKKPPSKKTGPGKPASAPASRQANKQASRPKSCPFCPSNRTPSTHNAQRITHNNKWGGYPARDSGKPVPVNSSAPQDNGSPYAATQKEATATAPPSPLPRNVRREMSDDGDKQASAQQASSLSPQNPESNPELRPRPATVANASAPPAPAKKTVISSSQSSTSHLTAPQEEHDLRPRPHRSAPKTPPVCTASADFPAENGADTASSETALSKSPIVASSHAISYAEDLLGMIQGKMRQVETPSKIPYDSTDVRRSPAPKQEKVKYSFLLGKRLERDIFTNDGKLLLAKDELITDATIQKAKTHDKLVLLALHSL